MRGSIGGNQGAVEVGNMGGRTLYYIPSMMALLSSPILG